jgi:hypothetical protein
MIVFNIFGKINKLFYNLFKYRISIIFEQKISAYYVFRKYRLKTIYSGTNFSRFFYSRLILSITAQPIFAVAPSAWACWKGILIRNIKKENNNNFFSLRITANGITQKSIFSKQQKTPYIGFEGRSK